MRAASLFRHRYVLHGECWRGIRALSPVGAALPQLSAMGASSSSPASSDGEQGGVQSKTETARGVWTTNGRFKEYRSNATMFGLPLVRPRPPARPAGDRARGRSLSRAVQSLTGASFSSSSLRCMRPFPQVHYTAYKDPDTGKHRTARGIFAVGRFAVGVVSVGVFARGVLVLAQFGAGALVVSQVGVGVGVVGQFALGLVAAVGQFALAGAFANGQFALAGVSAIGTHARSP